MTTSYEEEVLSTHAGRQPLVLRVSEDVDFQRNVLEKLGRLEAQMDMLVGDGQPGRLQQTEARLTALEKNDIKRSVYDRLLNAAITIAISAVIAMHEHFSLK